MLILSLLQIVIVDNIHLGSYFYLNIYILAIFLLPYKLKGVPLLLFGFLLGLLMDFADNTVGIHAAASTFVAYIRPRLLQLTSTREELEDAHGVQGLTDFRWFLKYSFMSTLLFNVVLIQHAVHIGGFEGVGHDGGKCSHHQDQGQVREDVVHVALLFHRDQKSAEVTVDSNQITDF